MKLKPVYIYLAVFVIVILAIVFTSTNSNDIDSRTDSAEVMPDDEVHKGLKQGGETPGKGNVTGSFRQQMDMLKKAYEENPDDDVKVKQYADLLVKAHQPDKAVELYNSILAKNPRKVDALLGITFAYFNMGKFEEAKKFTDKVLEIDKDHHEANYNLGAIAAGKGDKEKARKIWKDLIDRFPNTTVANVAEQSLNSLDQN